MSRVPMGPTAALVLVTLSSACAFAQTPASECGPPPPLSASAPGEQRVDLGAKLKAGLLRGVNRVAATPQTGAAGVYVNAADGPGVIWIEGTDFKNGTIALDVCGRDVRQQSFLGVAFHRRDDATYNAVYVRPFNFRASDPAAHPHAVQYIAVPDYDWPRLRRDFAEEFENPVDAAVSPTTWIPMRIDVTTTQIQIRVGDVTPATLTVRKLGSSNKGVVGLWLGNGSDGGFANLRLIAAD